MFRNLRRRSRQASQDEYIKPSSSTPKAEPPVEDSQSYGILEWVPNDRATVEYGENSTARPERLIGYSIVFVHGLNGHRERTWTAPNGIVWPKDLLPVSCPAARILTFGYDSRTHAARDLSKQTFHGHATTLLQRLSLLRRRTKVFGVLSQSLWKEHCTRLCGNPRRFLPIIFIAHSLGGLVVKSALIHANQATGTNLEHHRSIKLSTYGILFFGTPHQGGNGVALGKVLATIASAFIFTNPEILDHLEKGSEWLEQQLDYYKFIAADFDTKFFYETIPTRLPMGKTMLIVDKNSAIVPGASNVESVEVSKNHSDMVKIHNNQEEEYKNIEDYLFLMSEEASLKVERNWEAEKISTGQ
ncbi:hypothetical protein E4T38_09764 [Aureobasidium subglaciale]|nr:hypothetical protein E4T38_09764 [Aureobasidium subglaciale]KAI5213443.1 hypothetical protein E4T40_09726 [Aureobasidium subglaciale]KAI5214969.1 hypothetical protein E4T41_09765 [Aureobasidium subglaciale]KAI5252999.1 hypothetical protein E4T46_09740 [Aureobasidium subglaciale]